MAAEVFNTLITASKLLELLKNKVPIKILDASYTFYSKENIYKQKHAEDSIPGAIYFDFLNLNQESSGLYQHQMPSNSAFTSYMEKLRLKKDSTQTIIYSSNSCLTAAKLWFMLKTFGKENVAVLDGGIEKWKHEGFPTVPGNEIKVDEESINEQEFAYKLDQQKIKNYDYVSAFSELLKGPTPQTLSRIIDARSPTRFTGLELEPSKAKPGSIRGSKNLYFKYCLNTNFTFKTKEQILELFRKYELDLEKDGKIIHLSGIGNTACYNILAFELAGFSNNFLYDGGWVDWANKYNVPEDPVSVKGIMEKEYEKHLKKKFK